MKKTLIAGLVFSFAVLGSLSQRGFGQEAGIPGNQTQPQPGMPGGPGGAMPMGQPEMNQPPPLQAQQGAANEAAIASSGLSENAKTADNSVKVDKERISLDLKGIDINELFKILSARMSVTIVPSKNVSGRVNIFLNNLTFDNALDVILVSQDLACDKNGAVLNIMTNAEYERLYGKKYNEKRRMKTIKLQYAKPATVFNTLSQIKSDIGKLIVDETTGTIIMVDIPEKIEIMEKTAFELDAAPGIEIFDIKYAKAADIKTQLSSAITAGPGEMYMDERSSKLIISDLPEKMQKIRRMVKALDEASRQVFIEAEVYQLQLKDEFNAGINWEKILKGTSDVDFKGVFPTAPSFTPSPLITADYWSMAIGALGRDGYTASMQLLQSLGNTKLLSRPRLAVVNNQEARIMVGTRDAYITQTQSQGGDTVVTSESVQFIDVGVKLNVTPSINKDGFITMKIKPEVSSVKETITTALGSRVPIVETSEAETTVKVKDGTMIMIAGMVRDEKRDDRSGFPILCNLPLFKYFFGTNSKLKKRTEIVLFITPRIITGDEVAKVSQLQDLLPPDIVPDDTENMMIELELDKASFEGQRKPSDNILYQENAEAIKQEGMVDMPKMRGKRDVR